MLSGMKYTIRILIGVGIIALVGIAIWKGTSKPSVLQQATEFPTPTLAPLASVSPVVIAYDQAPADWKTYATASYSVRYPADWIAGSCGAPGCTGWAPLTASSQFVFGIIEYTESLDNFLASASPYIAAREEVTAGTNTWLKLTLQQPLNGLVITSHFIARGAKLYEFGTATADPALLEIYGKMIGSVIFK